jgi:hypothetical protein
MNQVLRVLSNNVGCTVSIVASYDDVLEVWISLVEY